MNNERSILAHLWKATSVGEWYCSGQPDGPSPGSSVLLVLTSTGEREEKDRDRSDPEYPTLPSRLYAEPLTSGIRLMREFSLN